MTALGDRILAGCPAVGNAAEALAKRRRDAEQAELALGEKFHKLGRTLSVPRRK